jgi:hypothetical protein
MEMDDECSEKTEEVVHYMEILHAAPTSRSRVSYCCATILSMYLLITVGCIIWIVYLFSQHPRR